MWKWRVFDAVGGFVGGLFGYVLAVWIFDYVGLFVGGNDRHDQAVVGLELAGVVAGLATLIVPILAVRARWLRPARSVGLAAGLLAGMAIVVHLFVVMGPVVADLPSACSCDPLIWQISGP